MRLARTCVVIVAVWVAGCSSNSSQGNSAVDGIVSVQQGHVDYLFPPVFEIPLGEYNSIKCFDRFTVIHVNGTYVTFGAPYYALLMVLIILFLMPLAISRIRTRLKEVSSEQRPTDER
jgi:hypothetical protein